MLCALSSQNLCVGAPCGVMDQMTAALGEAGQLTALLCQPAELQAGVQIPPQVGAKDTIPYMLACCANQQKLLGMPSDICYCCVQLLGATLISRESSSAPVGYARVCLLLSSLCAHSSDPLLGH